MIDPNFVKLMENTEKEAKRFFERKPGMTTANALINLAHVKGILNDPFIDADLFKHLMKKYTAIGY